MLSKDKKNLIVVPCDFTEEAQIALNHASRIAKQSTDEVRLLHIFNRESKSKLRKESAGEEAVYAKLKEWAEKNQNETGITTTYHAEEGSIFTTIAEYIKETDAAMMVMGTHGVRGVQHFVGSFAMKVVTSSPVPVIVVQKKDVDASGINKIVLPIDHNRHGKNKVSYAISIAKYFGAEVHVFEEYSSDEFYSKQIKLNTNYAIQRLEENNVKYIEVKEDFSSGSFTKHLIRHAAKIEADLIVISSHADQESIADLFLRSNEVEMINNDAMIPVMCVNPFENTSHLSVAGVG
ncbi:MAG: universal stress protein [Candidatus Competibacteraceae bacterium]|nr:universal stress protein [Candidatus Competibacteraceae bacterium]